MAKLLAYFYILKNLYSIETHLCRVFVKYNISLQIGYKNNIHNLIRM